MNLWQKRKDLDTTITTNNNKSGKSKMKSYEKSTKLTFSLTGSTLVTIIFGLLTFNGFNCQGKFNLESFSIFLLIDRFFSSLKETFIYTCFKRSRCLIFFFNFFFHKKIFFCSV
jgi:K+-sensing histidine kinase KdpD